MRIAITGCGHGELDKFYQAIAYAEQRDGVKVELLICCGDFQSCRNLDDLDCMACPDKYKGMHTFYQYYNGEKRAPVLTIFVGGNHEASNYLLELAHGGWVAPNIWYMGWANVVQYGGLRIGGISGIFKAQDFRRGHFECPPFDGDMLRSIYHVREFDVWRLLQTTGMLDIFMSHDWPQGIDAFGDQVGLCKRKKGFKEEVDRGQLGNPVTRKLLDVLQPKFWFAAHLHVKFSALVSHPDSGTGEARTTRFLALDKCLPGRDYLQFLDFPETGQGQVGQRAFCYDPEWLAIMRSTNPFLSLEKSHARIPLQSTCALGARFDFRPTEDEIKWISDAFREKAKRAEAKAEDNYVIPRNFTPTAPSYVPGPSAAKRPKSHKSNIKFVVNPQTEELLSTLEVDDKLAIAFGGKSGAVASSGISPDEDRSRD